jgi:hypothetical protein
MLDTTGPWRVEAPEGPRVDTLVHGRTIAEARAAIGQAFPSCRAAETTAFDIATGQPWEATDHSHEMRREHLTQIFMAWPHALGLRPFFDKTWLRDDGAALRALFGPVAELPASDFQMAGFLGSDDGVAPLLRVIGDLFGPGIATVDEIPLVDAETAFCRAPVENSPAARQSATPAMNYVEAMYGRGPLWRATGRVIDLARLLTGGTPRAVCVAPGRALVPSPRGYCALEIATEGDRVTSFARTTPTDHLLSPGGALDLMLARLPAHRGRLLPLLLALIDPCRPLHIEEMQPAARGDDG